MKSVQMVTTDGEMGASRVMVLVDGERIGGGQIGGESEDNYEVRDYKWIRPLIRALAKSLGASVEETIVKQDDD